MQRRAITVIAASLLLAAPALAHVGTRAGEEPAADRGLFAQQPIALPVQQPEAPPMTPTPRAKCTPGSKPEPSIQGRLPKEEVDSGRAAEGYWCNLERVGQIGQTGGFKVLRYVDENGHECAFYDTTLLFPTNAFNLKIGSASCRERV